MKRELTGHSGCGLNLIQMDGKLFVEKSAKDLAYNDRLKVQCEKQKQFASSRLQAVKVLASGYQEDGLFYFDMEYISGITMAEYLRDASLEQLDSLAEILCTNMEHKQGYDPGAHTIFQKKIADLEQTVKMNCEVVKKAFHYLKDYAWNYVIRSDCHGDFTLENILVSGNQIFLIDFLDSFYDSWLIDYAKILQDAELFWHYRYEPQMDVNLGMRLLILRKNLKERVLKLQDGPQLLDCIYHILLLNILRILPYTQEKVTLDYLLEKIDYMLKVIDKQSP